MSRQKKTTKEIEIETATNVAITESLTRIEDRIYVIRGKQVMLDRDLARLYGVETKRINEAVKRNKERFPEDFMFQLTEEETEFLKIQEEITDPILRSQFATSRYGCKSECYDDNARLRSQIATLNADLKVQISRWGGQRYLPYVFTESGIAMLSCVLHSQTAIKVNVAIMRAFTAMRHFFNANTQVFQRLETIEYHQLEMKQHMEMSDKRLEENEQAVNNVLQKIAEKDSKPLEGVFCDGRIFDAHTFVCDLIRSAKKDIVLIDNYIDDTVLKRLDERAAGIACTIYTKQISDKLQLHIDKHNAQYSPIKVIAVGHICHDRFLIIDNNELWHFGASFKDLGRSLFAFSKLHLDIEDVMKHVR